MIAFMSTDHIVALLVQERAKLNRAIEALQAGEKMEAAEIGVTRPVGQVGPGQPSKKRVISAATRRRMALGQRRRHAAKKEAATT
jgi:hypothetical protein